MPLHPLGAAEPARAVRATDSARVLRLTLLAPEIVEAILDGKQGAGVTLARLREPFPFDWEGQGELFGCRPRRQSSA